MSTAAVAKFVASESSLAFADDCLQSYLSSSPIGHALFRASEVMPVLLSERTLARPVMDAGCGRGEGARCLFNAPLDIGVDCDEVGLAAWWLNGSHLECTLGSLCALPLADSSINSIVCISVLEHLDSPEAAIREMHRVLRPGGVLLLTVMVSEFYELSLVRRLLKGLRQHALARLYLEFLDRLFAHRTMRPPGFWETALENAGFTIEKSAPSVPGHIVSIWEVLLPLSVPFWLCRRSSSVVVPRPRMLRTALNKLLELIGEVRPNQTGACQCLIATR